MKFIGNFNKKVRFEHVFVCANCSNFIFHERSVWDVTESNDIKYYWIGFDEDSTWMDLNGEKVGVECNNCEWIVGIVDRNSEEITRGLMLRMINVSYKIISVSLNICVNSFVINMNNFFISYFLVCRFMSKEPVSPIVVFPPQLPKF